MPAIIATFSFLILLLLGAIAYFLYVEEDRVYDLLYDDWEGVEMEGTERNINTRIYQYLTYVVVGLTAIIVIVLISLVPSLGKSVHILRLAARPLKNMPSLLLFPMIEIFLGLIVFVIMLGLCLSLISIGTIEREDSDVFQVAGAEIKIIDFYTSARLGMIFIIPMSLWWLSFLSMLGEYAVASSAAVWFFSKEQNKLDSPIALSLKNLFWYHLGSILWASIILPPLRSVKAIIGSIKGMTKSDNCCTKCIRGT